MSYIKGLPFHHLISNSIPFYPSLICDSIEMHLFRSFQGHSTCLLDDFPDENTTSNPSHRQATINQSNPAPKSFPASTGIDVVSAKFKAQ